MVADAARTEVPTGPLDVRSMSAVIGVLRPEKAIVATIVCNNGSYASLDAS